MEPDATVEAWRRVRALTQRPEALAPANAVAEQAGITPTLARALVALTADRPTSMRELAGALHCDASYVTAVVDGLEQHGLARRTAHPTDRRIKVVELTAEGAALAGRLQAASDVAPEALRALSPTDLQALLRVLRKT